MDRECFFNGRLNMPRGHHGFAVCLICERNERPAPLVGDVEAPTFCHASYNVPKRHPALAYKHPGARLIGSLRS
jgi:hypothetical protein